MKKGIIVFLVVILLGNMLMAGPLFTIDKQDGGIMTWVACILGGPRAGYMVNDKATNIDLLDVFKFIPGIGYLFTWYYAFIGLQNDGFWGCIAGYPGYTTAVSLEKYKSRTKEKFACCIIPAIQMGFEMFGGKKWTEVVKEENLRK